MEWMLQFKDYVILAGLNLFGISLVLASLYIAYRRKVALRIGFLFLIGAVVLNTLTFFLGKEGVTVANSLWVVGLGGPIVVATLLYLSKRMITPIITLKDVALMLTTGSQQIQAGAENLSQGASEQASSTEQVSATMEEMAATIRHNADNAFQMKQIAIHSADDAIHVGETVLETVEAMQKIEKKIVMIDDITHQTQILSLNATIEAAKAQEYGKGFAVVATEVRALATRSQEAATEIKDLIQIGVTLANKASDMLKRLIPEIQKTADVSQEISAASEEQSTGIQQVTLAIQQLDQVTQHNASMAEELSATADGFTQQADRLWKTITILDSNQQRLPTNPPTSSTPPIE